MELVFASHNEHKLKEVRRVIPENIHVIGLDDLEFHQEIEEWGTSIPQNAEIKFTYIFKKFKKNVFSDDSGLEVQALKGEPGVFSARYAGENCTFEDNNRLLLKNLKGVSNRNACFRTVICLILDDKTHFFEGMINGIITQGMRGKNGFGYDPIFQPDGYSETFAEMNAELKNTISHRSLAVSKLVTFLEKAS